MTITISIGTVTFGNA
jgi:hypothetical protein